MRPGLRIEHEIAEDREVIERAAEERRQADRPTGSADAGKGQAEKRRQSPPWVPREHHQIYDYLY